MASSVAVLDHAAFGAIIQRVFRERTSSMIEEARPYSVADLHDTVTRMRREMRTMIETLPDAAFTPSEPSEPSEPSGNVADSPQWSAGQIIAHTIDTQCNTFLRAARLAVGMGPSPVTTYPEHLAVPAVSRVEALALLETGDRDLEDVRASLPAGADVETPREDEVLGAAGYKDMLLFLGIHDDDHLEQLKALA